MRLGTAREYSDHLKAGLQTCLVRSSGFSRSGFGVPRSRGVYPCRLKAGLQTLLGSEFRLQPARHGGDEGEGGLVAPK